jgi:hypothetical protein
MAVNATSEMIFDFALALIGLFYIKISSEICKIMSSYTVLVTTNYTPELFSIRYRVNQIQ